MDIIGRVIPVIPFSTSLSEAMFPPKTYSESQSSEANSPKERRNTSLIILRRDFCQVIRERGILSGVATRCYSEKSTGCATTGGLKRGTDF